MQDGTFVAYYGRNNEWKLYAQSDGIIVGYRSRYTATGREEMDRVVTNVSDPDKFGDFLPRSRSKKKGPVNPPLIQLRIE